MYNRNSLIPKHQQPFTPLGFKFNLTQNLEDQRKGVEKILSVKKPKPKKTKKTPSKEQIVNIAWEIENPTRKGLRSDGRYDPYPDPNGEGNDVGAGLFIGRGIKYQKEPYTLEQINDAAYDFGLKGLEAIGDEYNKVYGNANMPNPWDTVSVKPKLLLLDTRYQNGSLPQEKWPSLYNAVARGDWAEALRQSRSKFDKNGVTYYDNDRVRRRAQEIFPGMFDVSYIKNSKKLPIIAPARHYIFLPDGNIKVSIPSIDVSSEN